MTAKPQGLKKSAKAKENSNTEEEAEIVLQLHEGSNDVDEVAQMAENALALIYSSDADQMETALMLLRGCVHECDKMIRIRCDAMPNVAEEERLLLQQSIQQCPVLPASFYNDYGDALFHLGFLEPQADPVEYIDMAVSQFEHGLAMEGINEVSGLLLKGNLLKCKMFKAKDDELVDECRTELKSITTFTFSKSSDCIEAYSKLCHSLHSFAKLHDFQLDEILTEAYERVLSIDNTNIDALFGIANLCIVQINTLLDDEDQYDEQSLDLLLKAVEYLTRAANACAEDDLNDVYSVHCLLGEAHVHLGNICDASDESKGSQHYSQAISAFTKAQSIFPLPDNFADLLNELEISLSHKQ